MMKKFMVIFVLTLFAVMGLNKYERVAWAKNDVEMDIDLSKVVSSDGESYRIEIEFGGGEDVKKVKTATIKIPSGKKMTLKNSLGLDDIELDATYGSYDEFKEKFPEGEYSITLSPKKYGSLKVDMTHDFPPTPVITYPEDGATDVPLNLTVTWEQMSLDVSLTLGGGNIDPLTVSLTEADTSYTIPTGLLQPNTEYELSLKVETIIGGGENGPDLETIRVIHFTTGSEQTRLGYVLPACVRDTQTDNGRLGEAYPTNDE